MFAVTTTPCNLETSSNKKTYSSKRRQSTGENLWNILKDHHIIVLGYTRGFVRVCVSICMNSGDIFETISLSIYKIKKMSD